MGAHCSCECLEAMQQLLVVGNTSLFKDVQCLLDLLDIAQDLHIYTTHPTCSMQFCVDGWADCKDIREDDPANLHLHRINLTLRSTKEILLCC